MKRSKTGDKVAIVLLVLIFFGIVYYIGIKTGKRITTAKEKEEEKVVVEETYPIPATSVELEVYGELVEKEPPPITAPSSPEVLTPAVPLKPEEKTLATPKKEIKEKISLAPTYLKRDIYTIQVASLKKREEAQRMVTKLRTKGYPAYMVSAMVGGVVHYRVRIGEFKSASEAKKMMERIKMVEKMKAFITLKER